MTPVGLDRWSLLGQPEQEPYHPGSLCAQQQCLQPSSCHRQQSFLLLLLAGYVSTDDNNGHGCPCLPGPLMALLL